MKGRTLTAAPALIIGLLACSVPSAASTVTDPTSPAASASPACP
jgi:hypothetical protein